MILVYGNVTLCLCSFLSAAVKMRSHTTISWLVVLGAGSVCLQTPTPIPVPSALAPRQGDLFQRIDSYKNNRMLRLLRGLSWQPLARRESL